MADIGIETLSASAARWEALYRSLGGTFAGAIPQYARSANGALHATAIYYLLLGERHGR